MAPAEALILLQLCVFVYVSVRRRCAGATLFLSGSLRVAWQDSDRPCQGPDALVCGQ